MAKQDKLVSHGSNIFPYTLWTIGVLLCLIAVIESYFQMNNTDFSFLKAAHNMGILTDYKVAKDPNKGIWHPLAWIGSVGFCVMMLYSVRKHLRFMQDVGPLRYWLDIHMFIGIVATTFVTVHTTYKFGGIVSLSFWSMILVAGSGLLGRYIYIQIPRSISGKELRMDEIDEIITEITKEIEKYAGKDSRAAKYFEQLSGPKQAHNVNIFLLPFYTIAHDLKSFGTTLKIRKELKAIPEMPPEVRKNLFRLIKEKGQLMKSMNYLSTWVKLLHYWHVFHKPFAVIMFIIMFLHIAVFYLFRANV